MRKHLGPAPYFWAQYLGAYLVDTDGGLSKAFERIPFVDDGGAHSLQTAGLVEDPPTELFDDLRNRVVPVYKLSNKRDVEIWVKNGIFDCLRENCFG